MSWFSKKEDKALLPDLPEDMEFPKLPEIYSDSWQDVNVTSSVPNVVNLKQKRPLWLPPLPSIKTESNKIVAEPMAEEIAEPMIELGLIREPLVREPMAIELAESFPRKPSKIKIIRPIKPIYIRLDKFKQGLESFEEIKSKVQEIEHLLKGVKDLREKEEKELGEWEKEIQIIKSRMEALDKDVFSELD